MFAVFTCKHVTCNYIIIIVTVQYRCKLEVYLFILRSPREFTTQSNQQFLLKLAIIKHEIQQKHSKIYFRLIAGTVKKNAGESIKKVYFYRNFLGCKKENIYEQKIWGRI